MWLVEPIKVYRDVNSKNDSWSHFGVDILFSNGKARKTKSLCDWRRVVKSQGVAMGFSPLLRLVRLVLVELFGLLSDNHRKGHIPYSQLRDPRLVSGNDSMQGVQCMSLKP